MKKILVTGGLGYIGSHTVVELQNTGFEVVIIDDLSNSSKEVLSRITSITGIKPDFEEIDLKNKQAVEQFFKNYSIDGVIHFAASKAVGESVNEPLKYYENNITTLTYVLKEMIANQVPNFIFSSSCTVYGQADELPITENAPTKPAESPYGATKKMGEIIIEDTTKVTALKAIALRYFNPIGAHETAKIGELPLGVPQNLVPFVVQTAAGIRECLSVFGDDYNTPDGTAVRDYIHVVDLAKAHIVALNRLLKNNSFSTLLVLNFLFFINSFFFNECHKPILFLAKYLHGNLSPGSFFLSGAMSECPKIFFALISYFFIKNLLSFIRERICLFENFL